MTRPKMHLDEIDVPESMVRALLLEQLPAWADLPLERVDSMGTVSAIYRLGDDLAVRLPLTPRFHSLDDELRWLPWLAPQLPLSTPEPLAAGEPGCDYPFRWAVFRWIDGDVWSLDRVDDPCQAARDLAAFLRTVHVLDSSDGPRTKKRTPAMQDPVWRFANALSGAFLDTGALARAWDDALLAPAWDGEPVWVHGDVLAGNVLVADGAVAAVIDWGNAHIGDPALDLIPAWSLFDGESRAVFRAEMDADDDAWARARATALTRIINMPYYAGTNPVFVADAMTTLERVLNDRSMG